MTPLYPRLASAWQTFHHTVQPTLGGKMAFEPRASKELLETLKDLYTELSNLRKELDRSRAALERIVTERQRYPFVKDEKARRLLDAIYRESNEESDRLVRVVARHVTRLGTPDEAYGGEFATLIDQSAGAHLSLRDSRERTQGILKGFLGWFRSTKAARANARNDLERADHTHTIADNAGEVPTEVQVRLDTAHQAYAQRRRELLNAKAQVRARLIHERDINGFILATETLRDFESLTDRNLERLAQIIMSLSDIRRSGEFVKPSVLEDLDQGIAATLESLTQRPPVKHG